MQPLKVVMESLDAAYAVVQCGEEGLRVISGYQTDLTTKGDKMAGSAILDVLKKYPILVAYSEESGKLTLKNYRLHTNVGYSAVYDDIDGSLNFKDGMDMLPCGSIIGVFSHITPKFEDCLASGFLELNSGNLFFAERGNGAYFVNRWARPKGRSGKEIRTNTSGRKGMEGKNPLKIALDFYMLGSLGEHFAHYGGRAWLGDFRSCAAHIAMVASGAADLFIMADNCYIPAKRKTGEELGPGYLLVKEAGGAVLDWNGDDIGSEEIGIDKKRTFHAVVASTESLGKQFVEQMQENPKIKRYMKEKHLL